MTPLHHAAFSGKSFLRLIISIKSLPILIDIFLDHANIIRTLIELGASVDAEDERQKTPLHYAATNGKSFILSQANIYY